MSTGPRCGQNCGGSSISPATVYFPQGYVRSTPASSHYQYPCHSSTYLVTDSIPLYYYTEVIGDARKPPTILAATNFNSTSLAIFGKLGFFFSGNAISWLTFEQMPTRTFLVGTEVSGT